MAHHPGRYFHYTGTQWHPVVPGPVHKANSTIGTTASTTYAETLTGSTGDPTAVTFTAPPSGSVLVSVGARISGTAAGVSCLMSANVRTGTTLTLAAADTRAAIGSGTSQSSGSTQFQVNGLAAGAVCTATAAYKSAATTNTATFAYRFVTVTPLT